VSAPQPPVTRDWLDIVLGASVTIVMVVVLALLLVGGRTLDFGYYTTFIGGRYAAPVYQILLSAAVVSVGATVIAFAIGLGLGFLTGWARALRPRPRRERAGLHGPPLARTLLGAAGRRLSRRLADFYVETMRGTPLLIQVVLLWSILQTALPSWDPTVRNLFTGVLAMTINTGGYQAETFRGGFQAVAPGQVEAAHALGMTRWLTMRHVVLPQAFRLVIPPLLNEFIALFKASSLLSWIGVIELTKVGKDLTFVNPHVFELFLLLTAIYLVVTVPLSRVVSVLEERLRIPGLGVQALPRQARRLRGRATL